MTGVVILSLLVLGGLMAASAYDLDDLDDERLEDLTEDEARTLRDGGALEVALADGGDAYEGSFLREDVTGGDGDDFIQAKGEDDVVAAGPGDDTVFGGSGDDVIRGEDGDDVLDDERGANLLDGGAGDDVLQGRDRADEGAATPDRLIGGPGDDLISGDDGDVLRGGAGLDVFRLIEPVSPEAEVEIVDFEPGRDVVSVALDPSDAPRQDARIELRATEDGTAVLYEGRTLAQLAGVDPDELAPRDFRAFVPGRAGALAVRLG